MAWGWKKKCTPASSEKPKSGASHSSSDTRESQSSGALADVAGDGVGHAVSINLAASNLSGSEGGGGGGGYPMLGLNEGGAATNGGGGGMGRHQQRHPLPGAGHLSLGHASTPSSTTPSSSRASGVTNLIVLLERGEWSAASDRALTHPKEASQLVKLRKTTRSSGVGVGGQKARIGHVKCKALHHACQRLRSVHTHMYQRRPDDDGKEAPPPSPGGKLIEEDEWIQACKCILTLIQVHPDACKDRESRHGCLPIHLAAFSMCATPPPSAFRNQTSVSNEAPPPSNDGDFSKAASPSTPPRPTKGPSPSHRRAKTENSANEAPPKTHRSHPSAPLIPSLPLLKPPPRAAPHLRGHSSTPSEGDFSMGDMSAMIEQESIVGPRAGGAVTSPAMLSVAAGAAPGEVQHEDEHDETAAGLTSRIDDMDQVLLSLQEEIRETKKGGGIITREECNGGGVKMAASNGAEGVEVRGKDTAVESKQHAFDSSPFSSSQPPEQAAQRPKPKSQPSSHLPSQTLRNDPLTHEEMHRRYLQINLRRREEYSVRVINALLDAWPKGSKTISEGGRMPLHMACFGRATVRVVETVLNAYPAAARERNADGFLPVHIAAHWGVSHPDVAPLILRHYPDGAVGRNRWERTPIEEALGMAGENGREHQMSLVWALRRHPTYWIHNNVELLLQPRNVRNAPWRKIDEDDKDFQKHGRHGSGDCCRGVPSSPGVASSPSRGRTKTTGMPSPYKVHSRSGGAVDVDEVGSSDDDSDAEESRLSCASTSPKRTRKALKAAENKSLAILITHDKYWEAAVLRCRRHPHEAREVVEVKVRGAYAAKVTSLHFACEQRPPVDVVRALVEAHRPSAGQRQEPGGQLPLHAACTWGSSAEVVHILLEAYPAAAKACDFLFNLPLHCAAYSGSSTDAVRFLVRAFPNSVLSRNHQGSSASDIVGRLTHPNRKEVLKLLEDMRAQLLNATKEEGVEVNANNGLMWV